MQKRVGQPNPKSISEKYNPEEDGGSGCPIEPSKESARNVYSHSDQSMHPTNFGSSRNKNINEDRASRAPGLAYVSPSKSAVLRPQRSFIQRGAARLSRFSNSVAVRGNSQFHGSSATSVNSHWPEEHFDNRYNNLDDSSHHLLGRPNFSQKEKQPSGLDSTTVRELLA